MSWIVTLSTPRSSMRTAAASRSACFPRRRVMWCLSLLEHRTPRCDDKPVVLICNPKRTLLFGSADRFVTGSGSLALVGGGNPDRTPGGSPGWRVSAARHPGRRRGDDHPVLEAGYRQALPGFVLQVGEQPVIARIAQVEGDLVDAGDRPVPPGPGLHPD